MCRDEHLDGLRRAIGRSSRHREKRINRPDAFGVSHRAPIRALIGPKPVGEGPATHRGLANLGLVIPIAPEIGLDRHPFGHFIEGSRAPSGGGGVADGLSVKEVGSFCPILAGAQQAQRFLRRQDPLLASGVRPEASQRNGSLGGITVWSIPLRGSAERASRRGRHSAKGPMLPVAIGAGRTPLSV